MFYNAHTKKFWIVRGFFFSNVCGKCSTSSVFIHIYMYIHVYSCINPGCMGRYKIKFHNLHLPVFTCFFYLCLPVFCITIQVEMVYSLLSMLGTHDKDDMSRTLLAMSSSQDSCIAMRQSGQWVVDIHSTQLYYTSYQDRRGTYKNCMVATNLTICTLILSNNTRCEVM